MRIHELELSDQDSDWKLAPTQFFPDLTLLVGITGVGKTRILRAVSMLRDISEGEPDNFFWGITWRVRFTTDDESEYEWSGAFEQRDNSSEAADDDDDYSAVYRSLDVTPVHPKIINETLFKNGEAVVERNTDGIRFRGQPTLKLSPYESIVSILSEEDDVGLAYQAFQQVLSVDHRHDSRGLLRVPNLDELYERLNTLEQIRNSNLSTQIKLGLVHRNDRETFDWIVERFMSVFPRVEDVEIRHRRFGHQSYRLQIRIKERGVSKWIPEQKISSGMSRTLMHLSRMALWPDGMVVLIDEFENSLGVNCIDFVTKDLVDESGRLQFIITSHHPYIINNIDMRRWKIVVREGSTVSTRDATEFGLEASSHEAFLKLMNLPHYQEGIAVE